MLLSEGLRIIFGLIAVLGLIGACAIAARKFGLVSASGGLVRKRRLQIVETLALDTRRRLAIVRCDDREHLIILGQSSETLIDSHPTKVIATEPATIPIDTVLPISTKAAA